MRPEVSVILPFYNAERTLSAAIQSILDQIFPDFELILVDNNSSDRSGDVAREYISDPRVRIFYESRQGVAHAANTGMREARGGFIARMDADDISLPGRLQAQLMLLEDHSDIGLVSGLVEYLGADITGGFANYLDWVNRLTDPNEIRLHQFVEYPIVNPTIMFRGELLDRFGGYREGDFPEDYEFFLRLQQGGVKMAKVTEPVLQWNDLPTRLTRTHTNYTETAFNRVRFGYLAEWLSENNPFHPGIWLWGAGKKARERGAFLKNHGIEISGYIEVNQKSSSSGLPVIHFEDLPTSPDRFIVSAVANWGARAEIREFLKGRGWKEGADFILAA